ncbi:TPA: hypothetical protein MX306_004889 [Citrobacter freundii]|nr:hypothetical protein [Citrobacter freundii]
MISIDKIIDKRVSISVERKEQGSEITLLESDPGSSISKLVIKDVPDDTFAFTLDYNDPSIEGKEGRIFRKLSPYLSSDNGDGINRSCDLVIVSQSEQQDGVSLNIIVLDLKSGNVGSRGKSQLDNSILFLDYILSMCKFHYEDQINSVKYYKRLITTQISKSPIASRARKSMDTKKVSVKAPHKTSNINYERLTS